MQTISVCIGQVEVDIIGHGLTTVFILNSSCSTFASHERYSTTEASGISDPLELGKNCRATASGQTCLRPCLNFSFKVLELVRVDLRSK